MDRVKNEVMRLSENIEAEVKSLDVRLESVHKSSTLKTTTAQEQLDKLEKWIKNRTQIQNKELDFLKQGQSKFERDYRQHEWYVNKVLPLQQYSQVCNMLHCILHDKESYNNLVEYELKWWMQIKVQNLSILKEKDHEKIAVHLPNRPVLKRAAKAVTLLDKENPYKQ